MTEKIWNSKFIVYCLLFIVHFKTHIMYSLSISIVNQYNLPGSKSGRGNYRQNET